jgi:hypothetical protein
MKRKQGRVTERSRTVREGKKRERRKFFFTGHVCAYLTCLLMGDPGDPGDSMGGIFLTCIGMRRTTAAIGLMNLIYNMARYEQLMRLANSS